jgi:hypothetical protein
MEKMLKKVNSYITEDKKPEGEGFLYDGLLMMIYKYTICNKNLVKQTDYWVLNRQIVRLAELLDW